MYDHNVGHNVGHRPTTGDQEQDSQEPKGAPAGATPKSASPGTAPVGSTPVGSTVVREIVLVLFPALILALTIHLFLAQATIVFGRSMEPSLFERQRLIIDKITYYFRAPHRSDIVVIKRPDMEELLVKRIIGLPTEKVEIRDGYVYINDRRLPEPFPHGQYPQNIPAYTLGPLEYYVLGDNRGNSNDSRAFGPVLRADILGRVWFRYWPLNQLHSF
jgi:signal peptidase I